jgi:hypothetical protein
VRTFKTKAFTRFADKASISDAALCGAVRDAERGLVAAELLAYDDRTLARVVASGVLVEVKCDEETVS